MQENSDQDSVNAVHSKALGDQIQEILRLLSDFHEKLGDQNSKLIQFTDQTTAQIAQINSQISDQSKSIASRIDEQSQDLTRLSESNNSLIGKVAAQQAELSLLSQEIVKKREDQSIELSKLSAKLEQRDKQASKLEMQAQDFERNVTGQLSKLSNEFVLQMADVRKSFRRLSNQVEDTETDRRTYARVSAFVGQRTTFKEPSLAYQGEEFNGRSKDKRRPSIFSE